VVTHPLWNWEEGRALVERGGDLEGAWSDENFWRVMSLTRKPSMTTSPRKNLPRTSLFFSVQILSLGAVDKTYNSICEFIRRSPLPNERKSRGLVLRTSVSVTQISAQIDHRFLSHCRSGGGGFAINSYSRKMYWTGRSVYWIIEKKKNWLKYKFFIHYWHYIVWV
jgi:hypothetical protein